MKFRLHEFYAGNMAKIVIKSVDSGKGGYTNAYVIFEPDTEYETNDPVLIKFIKGEIGEPCENPVWTPEFQQVLEHYGIPYEKNKCSTCPSAKPHIKYNPFKIVEE